MRFGAHAEIGKLRKVLMHRPGKELFKVTQETLSHYRFRDVPNLEKIQIEFDAFTDVLRNEGVEVFLLENLVEAPSSPNLLFTRDILSVSDIGLIVMNMAVLGRMDEPQVAKQALQREIPVALEVTNPGRLEGGDLVYIDEKTLAIGYGPRSNLEGMNQLIQSLKDSQIEEIVSVPLPSYRVHLDGAFMVVASDLCVIHEPSVSHDMAQIAKEGKIWKEPFLSYLKKKGFDKISVAIEETKTFGPNLLTLETGKVVSYEWNKRIITELEKRGVDVTPIEGSELVKGGGGPHCMTCPILRE